MFDPSFKLKIALGLIPVLAFLALPVKGYGDSSDKNMREGLSLYRQNEFEKAEKSFLEARRDKPDDPALTYNLANSQYKTGKFLEALQGYTSTIDEAEESSLTRNSLYNAGNSLYRMGRMEEAAAAYKKALELDPGDMDTKFNLEFVQQQIKKKPPRPPRKDRQNQENKDQGKSDKGEPPRDPASGNDPDDGNKPEKSFPEDRQEQAKKGGKEDPPASPEEQDQNADAAPAQLVDGTLTEEEARRRLASLTENLKKFLKIQADKNKEGPVVRGNDW